MLEKDFIKSWIDILSSDKLKIFPDDFINKLNCNNIYLPETNLLLGSELFGKYEILDAAGNSILQTDSIYYAKYILYSNRFQISNLNIPQNDSDIINIVRTYEIHLDDIIKEIEKGFKKEFPKANNFIEISNKIFTALNLKRY
jgi:hypothetical protein